MAAILSIVLPVFALILTGWVARRAGVLGPQATREITRFVIYLSLPAVLFDIVANARWEEIWQPRFIAAFGLGAGAIFGLTIFVRLRQSRPLADAAIDGLNAAYANTGFVGFPLAAATLGQAALAPALIATIITVCVVFAVAIVLIEIGLETELDAAYLVKKVGLSVLKNPLFVAPAAAAVVLLSGLHVAPPLESFLKLLGGAASPCALVALGLFLGNDRERSESNHGATSLLTALKLLGQPAVTWVLATRLFHLSPLLTESAVLLAALPTGTGAFMLAEFYGREADTTSDVVVWSTGLSLATITTYLRVAS
jgi:predicted permease